MSQIIENWSRLCGTVEAWEPPASPDDEGVLTMRVDTVGDIAKSRGAGWPNLLESTKGTTVRVRVPASGASRVDVRPGQPITVDVRRGRSPDALFAHPDLRK